MTCLDKLPFSEFDLCRASLSVCAAQSWMATYFIAASRKQEGSSQLRDQRSPYSMRGMVDNKLVFSKKGLDCYCGHSCQRGTEKKTVQWCDDPGSLRVSVSFGLTVEGEPANVHFYSMSCEYELLPGRSALKPLRQFILSVVKSKISLFIRDSSLKFCDISVLWLWNVFYLLVSPRYSAFIQSLTNTKHRQAESDCRNRDGCTTVEAWRDPHSVHSHIHYSSLNHTNSMLLVS